MIHHFTHRPIRKEIDSSGFIGLEGCRLEYFIEAGLHLDQPRASELSYQWRTTKKEYKARGRFVWFTEQQFCYAIGNRKSLSCVTASIRKTFERSVGRRLWRWRLR